MYACWPDDGTLTPGSYLAPLLPPSGAVDSHAPLWTEVTGARVCWSEAGRVKANSGRVWRSLFCNAPAVGQWVPLAWLRSSLAPSQSHHWRGRSSCAGPSWAVQQPVRGDSRQRPRGLRCNCCAEGPAADRPVHQAGAVRSRSTDAACDAGVRRAVEHAFGSRAIHWNSEARAYPGPTPPSGAELLLLAVSDRQNACLVLHHRDCLWHPLWNGGYPLATSAARLMRFAEHGE